MPAEHFLPAIRRPIHAHELLPERTQLGELQHKDARLVVHGELAFRPLQRPGVSGMAQDVPTTRSPTVAGPRQRRGVSCRLGKMRGREGGEVPKLNGKTSCVVVLYKSSRRASCAPRSLLLDAAVGHAQARWRLLLGLVVGQACLCWVYLTLLATRAASCLTSLKYISSLRVIFIKNWQNLVGN